MYDLSLKQYQRLIFKNKTSKNKFGAVFDFEKCYSGVGITKCSGTICNKKAFERNKVDIKCADS